VLPLAAGSLLLIAFAVYPRWDNLWRDPGRLPTTRAMYVALVFFIVCIVVRLLIVDWHAVGLDLLLTTLAVGVLVGSVATAVSSSSRWSRTAFGTSRRSCPQDVMTRWPRQSALFSPSDR
jgi:hypothetical protein